jgi:hypothetical protein
MSKIIMKNRKWDRPWSIITHVRQSPGRRRKKKTEANPTRTFMLSTLWPCRRRHRGGSGHGHGRGPADLFLIIVAAVAETREKRIYHNRLVVLVLVLLAATRFALSPDHPKTPFLRPLATIIIMILFECSTTFAFSFIVLYSSWMSR